MKTGNTQKKMQLAVAAATVVSLALALGVHAKDGGQAAEKSAALKSDKTSTVIAAKPTKAAHRASAGRAHHGPITEKQAVELVSKLPDVKRFMANSAKSKMAQPAIDVDRKEGESYVVHVYEVVNDSPHDSHTATMNWYYVNIKTGKISTEF